MIPLFLALTAVNLCCLIATTVLGYCVSHIGKQYATAHQLAGIFAAIVCCAVHCIVFTYFMATAKWVQHAVTVKRLDQQIVSPTRSFKAQAFPAALLAMASVCVAAFVGAATFGYQLRPIWHHATAIVAVVVNLLVAFVEYRAIARNGQLIDGILAQISHQSVAASTARD